jgi:hypothetical protein
MLYRKNLPGPERMLRLFAGAAIAAGGLYWFGMAPAGYALAAAGVFTGLTALFGFCPACAQKCGCTARAKCCGSI